MLDIIGNIKVTGRKEFLFSCLRSLEFYKDRFKLYLNLEGASDGLINEVSRELETLGYDHTDTRLTGDYGQVYITLLKLSQNPFVLNFMEDHFMLMDDKEWLDGLLNTMQNSRVDLCKASFFSVEQNSSKNLSLEKENEYGKIFVNNLQNHKAYSQFYGHRYFIGVNFITSREFALQFWNRHGKRPHDFEINQYQEKWKHRCIIPAREILCAIDDGHGSENSNLLARNEEKYFRSTVNPAFGNTPTNTIPVSAELFKRLHD